MHQTEFHIQPEGTAPFLPTRAPAEGGADVRASCPPPGPQPSQVGKGFPLREGDLSQLASPNRAHVEKPAQNPAGCGLLCVTVFKMTHKSRGPSWPHGAGVWQRTGLGSESPGGALVPSTCYQASVSSAVKWDRHYLPLGAICRFKGMLEAKHFTGLPRRSRCVPDPCQPQKGSPDLSQPGVQQGTEPLRSEGPT